MIPLSRFRNQQEAAEKKKALLERLQATWRKKKSPPLPLQEPGLTAEAAETCTNNGTEISRPVLKPLAEQIDVPLHLYCDPDYQPVTLTPAANALVRHALAAATAKSRIAVLPWPAPYNDQAFIHAFATISRWRMGDKRGIRTLLYPAKANTFYPLNHIRANRRDITALASSLYEPALPSAQNPLVTRSCRAKDPFLLALNTIEDNGEPFHPTIAELIPYFYSDLAFESWTSCADDLLRHAKGRLQRRSHRQALSTLSAPEIGSPSTAPDALFAIGWRTPREDIPRALAALKSVGEPDLVIVDATRSMRKTMPAWRTTLSRFIENIHTTFGDHGCGVVLVTDEPWVVSHLRHELDKRAEKAKTLKHLSPNDYKIAGVLCTTNDDGVTTEIIRSAEPKPIEIDIKLTDAHASRIIARLQQLKNRLGGGHPAEQPLAKALAFLSNLAALPAGPKTVMAWLDDSGVPPHVRDGYTWLHYRAALKRIADEPGFEEKSALLEILAQVDAMWESYQKGTPFARALADLIEIHTRGTEKCCVVFTRPTARRLAERYFETYDGYPAGAGFEVLRDCVRFIVTADLEDELQACGDRTVVFAGLDEESLRILLTEERLSKKTYVLLTQRNAAYLKALFRSVSDIQAFAPLRTRIGEMRRRLDVSVSSSDKTVFSRDDFVLPTFSFETGLAASATEESDETDPTAWRVILENGATLYRGEHSTVFVYDPAHPKATHHGYRPVEVANLREGDRVFVMSGELRELLENGLKEAGIPVDRDRRFEDALAHYHQRVIEQSEALFPGLSVSARARALVGVMRASADCPADLPTEQTVRAWIDLRKHEETAFEDKKPFAPRVEAHFKVFSAALQMTREEAIWVWRRAIQPLRGIRRADGRRLSEVYTYLLLEPESVEVHNRLKPGLVANLFARARDNIYVVENVIRPVLEVPSE